MDRPRIALPNGGSMECWCVQTDAQRGAVVICPGGGYEWVSQREGAPVARAFNRIGYHAFVVTYACEPLPLGDRPLHTVSCAVASVRAQAAEWKIDPRKVAVCGFSSGGHLACSLGILWNHAERFPVGTDLQLHRPDAMILSYPVVTAGRYAHRGSMERLAGADLKAQEAYSLERFVSAETPPTFLWHTADDGSVPVRNSLLLAEALTTAQTPFELHIYAHGTHGLSLATKEVEQPEKNRFADAHIAGWFDEMTDWLRALWKDAVTPRR